MFEMTSRLSISEDKHALNVYGLGKKVCGDFKIVASGNNLMWSEIKRGVEAKLGKILNNALSNIFKNLINQGFLEKVDGI